MGLFTRNPSSPDPRTVVLDEADLLERQLAAATGTTSYSTQGRGSIEVDKNATIELGSGSVAQFRETIPQLSSRTIQLRQWDIMSNNDSATDVSLRASKTPILGATYFMEAFSDDPLDQDISEFVDYNLLGGMTSPFLNSLVDIMRMYEYGSSILEKVYEPRVWAPKRSMANRKEYTMLRKLAPRPTQNVKKFKYDDNGGPDGILYNSIDSEGKVHEVPIPINKLVVFTHERKGGDLFGKSLLRTAYKHWYYKDNLYKIDGIQKERHSLGVPKARLSAGFTPEDVAAARKLVKNLRTNEESGMVLPPNIDVEFAEMKGHLVDVMRSIDHHNAMIMLNVMVQFLMMGISEGGGRATAGAHQDMFTKALRYVGNLICDQVNMYVIPQLVGYNFDTQHYPKLRIRNIGETKDLQQWASAVSNLITTNAITVDYEFEQWIREVADAPRKTGGRQTPENNPSKTGFGEDKGTTKPGSNGKGSGNMPAPTDNAGS